MKVHMQLHSLVVRTGLGLSALLCGSATFGQTPSLGAAQDFAVLGASTVTSAGASVITGDLGVSPGTAITGFPPATVTGTIHAGDAVALQAQSDLTLAYDALAGAAVTVVMTGQDLGGLTLTPGVYKFAGSAPLNGMLTLDALGDTNAAFVFQIGSTLLAAIDSSVLLINSAHPERVFWQVGSSATLAAGASFTGNVIALASITMSVGSDLSGRALARTGAVTMDTASVSLPSGNGCGTLGSVQALVPGCGPNSPILSCTTPTIGLATTALITGASPGRVGFLLVSPLGAAQISFHNCPVFYDPKSTLVLAAFVTDGTGSAMCLHAKLPPSLCGTEWTLQALILAGRNTSVSNGLLLAIGS